MFAFLAKHTGIPQDQLVAVSAMLAGYPISIAFNMLFDGAPQTAWTAMLKHVYSLVTCSAIMLAFFDAFGLANLIGITLLTWVLSRTLPRRRLGPVTMAIVMLHLAANHLAKQLTATLGNQKAFDFTASLMVLAIKLTSYAFSVGDSAVPEEKMTPLQRARVIREVPGLLEFMGYAFFWGGFLAGPAFDYSLYAKWIDGSLYAAAEDADAKANGSNATSNGASKEANGHAVAHARPKTVVPTLRALGTGLSFAVLYALFGKYGYHYLLTPAYASLSTLPRIMWLNVTGIVARTKFYAAWKIAEGACIAVGLGYTPPSGDKPATFSRLSNVNPTEIEGAQNLKQYGDNWNINTQSWLRFTVHERCKDLGIKGGLEVWIVFLVSSFWHGFYPGYYMTFLSLAVMISLSRTIRNSVRPLFVSPSPLAQYKRLYDLATWLTTQLVVNYTVAPFMLLTWHKSWSAWAGVGYWGHIAALLLKLALMFGGERELAALRRRYGVESERVKLQDVGKKKS
ncbi:MBOAT, membrane-bound O-acyltransferase family-domain-containing protein [Hyaloraphidium curvatum]|nr:MBOAT, membrane-bound O-acyltransferase family-domain-containing protein [Hyaloraphidium curvatum]